MQNAISLGALTEEPGRPSHTLDYAVLATFLFAFVFVLLFVAKSRELRFQALMIMVLGYALWGIVHHMREDTLTWNILLEYIGIAAFISSVLAVLFFFL